MTLPKNIIPSAALFTIGLLVLFFVLSTFREPASPPVGSILTSPGGPISSPQADRPPEVSGRVSSPSLTEPTPPIPASSSHEEEPGVAADTPSDEVTRLDSPDSSTTPTLTQVSTLSPDEVLASELQLLAAADHQGTEDSSEASATPDQPPSEFAVGDGPSGRDAMEGDAVIAGRVMRRDSPVPGASLRLIRESSSLTIDTETGNDGYYLFDGIASGTWILQLVSPAAPSSIRRLSLEPGEERLAEDFLVSDLPPVTGEVLDNQSGTHVPSAHLEIYRSGGLVLQTVSGAEGFFELPPLDAGTYLVRGTATGYSAGEQTFVVTPTGEPIHVFLRLEPTRVLEVLVLGDGQGVSGAFGALFGSAVFGDSYAAQGIRQTGGDGRFSIALPPGVTTGSYRAGVWASGFVPAYGPSLGAENVPDGGPVIIPLNRGASVTGRILDEEQEPLAGAEVAVTSGFLQTAGIFQRFSRPLPSTTTDAQGRFELRAIEPGPVSITVSLEGYHSASRNLDVSAGGLDVGVIALEPSDRSKTGRIAGVLVDELGRAIAGHGVHIRNVRTGNTWQTSTSARGNFSFEDVDDGDYILFSNGSILRGDDFITMDQTYPFVSAGGESVYLLYDLGQSIRMRVVDAAGRAVRQFTVGVITRYEGAPGNGGRRESFGMATQRPIQSTDGRAVLSNLLAGDLEQLTIQADGATRSFSNLRIPTGGTLDLGDVTLEVGGTIQGLVTDAATGEALGGISIRAEAPPGSGVSHPLASLPIATVTAGNGVFQLRSVPSGSVLVVIQAPGRVTVTRTVQAQSGEPRDLGVIGMERSGAVSGMVVDNTGRGVGGARVDLAGISLISDHEGRFFTDILPPGPVTVVVTHPGWASQSAAVNVSPGEVSNVEIRLGGGPS